MTIVNGRMLLEAAPIKDMLQTKEKVHGTSFGLSEAGYDIRIKQQICFFPGGGLPYIHIADEMSQLGRHGRFVIASAIEEFQMPDHLVGVVHDKSTWARKGLSVFNTVIEPGWKGFLTLELVFHGNEEIVIEAGSGIGQVLFSHLAESASYDGKYQNQENKPVPSRFE